VWPEDVAEPQAAPVATNEDWATPVVEDATATVEVESEDEPVAVPEWAVTEVSADPRYFNSNLARNPYKSWTRR
jgi:CYTH domain-containing protein